MLNSLMAAFIENSRSIVITECLFFIGLLSFLFFMGRCILRQKLTTNEWIALLSIVTLATAIRCAWIVWTQPEPHSDFGVYWQYANQFFEGNYTYNIIIRHPGVMMLHAIAMQFMGQDIGTVYSVNLILSSFSLIVVFAITRLLFASTEFAKSASWLSLIVASLTPQMIAYTALPCTEIPAVAFSLLLFWVLLDTALDQDSRLSSKHLLFWVALGFLLFANMIIRSTNLLYLVLTPFVFFLTRRADWQYWLKRYLVFAATGCLLISNWVFHQYLVGGSPRLFWGDELWTACAIQYHRGGMYTDHKDMAMYPAIKPYIDHWKQTGAIADEVKLYEQIGKEVHQTIWADPGRYLTEGFVRAKNILWTSQTGIRWVEKGSYTLQHMPKKLIKRMCTLSNVFWQVCLILSPVGILALWRRRKALSATGQEVLYYTSFYLGAWILFHYLLSVASERYAFQIIPFVEIFAIAGLLQLGMKLQNVTRKKDLN